MEFTPVIIIGAGRSGTNMLRDAICALPDFATWDCDEINPIWRHGNTHHPDDHLTADHATADVKKFIRAKFIAQWKKQGKPQYLVEKTCANSLRVSFIASVLPEAKFLYLVRNGTDVTASASKRWRGEMEIPSIPYFLSKIRNTPISDLPHYGWRFLTSRADIYTGKKQHMSFWGPQFPGLKELSTDTPLLELCARQWASCVNKSDISFSNLPVRCWLKIRYEDIVINPSSSLNAALEFLGVEVSSKQMECITNDISSKNVGKATKISNEFTSAVNKILAAAMIKHNYTE